MNPPAGPALRRRPMRVADLDDVMAIEVGAYGFPWTRGNFIDSLAAGCLAELVDDERGRPIAYLVAMYGHEETHVLNLTVHASARRQGLGAGLLEGLAARARERGDRQLWLEVRAGNEVARRLYRRCGFLEVGLRRGYYPAGHDAREDAVVMQRVLDGR